MKKLVWLVLAFCSLLLVACSGGQNQSGKLKVMTTFYPVYEFTKQVVGDEGDVELLIGSGSEPHDFELSAKGRAKIQESDVFVYENENMETWVPQLLKSMDGKKTKVVKATEICYFYQVVRKSMTMREGKNTIMTMIPMSGFLHKEPLKWWKRFAINW